MQCELQQSGESRKLRASALKVLEQALDEIARNGHAMSGSEKADQHRISGYACTSSKNVVEHQPQQGLMAWLESEHVGGVHEICVNPETILSSLLMMTRPDLVGRSCLLTRIALRSSCVHLEASLCQGTVRPNTSCCLVARIPFHPQSTIVVTGLDMQSPRTVRTCHSMGTTRSREAGAHSSGRKRLPRL